ncbi:predicted protein [Chaetomium globosum CBS 148.51]|uniref:Uncharacterized protein n=1 Tax=Chaetomium globosum (strain ATCC 6205 / CBS 148.51 / DSM 1962 / NBRC 6347 / NRRL 1970) TaxID=306901 RepID=Q2HA44_CHAGB|nr:uncharacterized protein CHGG_02910 [Chaetomium globosum CBS 148.51]EAQ90975.1 predicted protein [Chaetomium globosum CBS 148.51]
MSVVREPILSHPCPLPTTTLDNPLLQPALTPDGSCSRLGGAELAETTDLVNSSHVHTHRSQVCHGMQTAEPLDLRRPGSCTRHTDSQEYDGSRSGGWCSFKKPAALFTASATDRP